jgi:hypothetical protein
MDIRPHVNILESIRAERQDYVLCLGEGVDNAFDADAKRIQVAIDDHQIAFKDDGVGVTRDRLRALARLGEHQGMKTTALGRFGIGIKHQAINCGDVFVVVSSSIDGIVRLEVNWLDILRSGDWEIVDPDWRDSATAGAMKTGTTVSIDKLRRRPKESEKDDARRDLARRFHPALTSGRQIVFNGINIEPIKEPLMTDVIDGTLFLSSNPAKGAHVRAGMLCDPASPLFAVDVGYKHRNILISRPFGCGDYGGFRSMYARVELIGDWQLSKFKNEITDDDSEELQELICEKLKPILEKCKTKSMCLNVEEMTRHLNDMLPPELTAKVRPEKKKTTPPKAAAKKKSAGPGAASAPESKTGPARGRKKPPCVKIEFVKNIPTKGLGYFDCLDNSHWIFIAEDDPTVSELLKQRDKKTARTALYLIAVALYAEGLARAPVQGELPLFDFGTRMQRLLGRQDLQRESEEAVAC